METKERKEIGSKSRAGTLLSSFLRAIAQEKVVRDDLDKGEQRTMSKAEALAYLIWSKALGYEEHLPDGEIIVHEPDKDMIKLIYDRMEGKVATQEDNIKREISLPDRISETNKKRLNKLVDRKT